MFTDPIPDSLDPEHPDWVDSRWVSVADARSALDPQTLRYVRVAFDGSIRAMIDVSSDGIFDACDGPCPNLGDAPSLVSEGGFVATASAHREAVWVASTAAEVTEIWRYDVLSARWSRLGDVDVDEQILAITYDSLLDRLIVLGGGPGNRQLHEVGIAGGSVLLAELGGSGEATSFGLSVGDDRTLYVVAAEGDVEAGTHCTLRLTRQYVASGSPLTVTGGTPIQEGFVPAEGVLASPAELSLVAFGEGAAWVRGYESFPDSSCLEVF